jgi:pSer/pThr/pTyr-binding forkhead associated (FHA) protein
VRASRPPLGVLVVDDGTVLLLTGDVIIGREPGLAEEVTSGRAQPLQLRDETHSVSRVHAHVRLTGWEVTVVDSGSSNGTFLSSTGTAGPWVRVEEPTPLAPGDRIRLGKRQLMFDRHPAGPAHGPAD